MNEKMNDLTKTLLITLVICLFLGGVFYIQDHYFLKPAREKQQNQVNQCWKLEGCKVYGCLSEVVSVYNRQRNLLLQEQNCLLEKQMESRK